MTTNPCVYLRAALAVVVACVAAGCTATHAGEKSGEPYQTVVAPPARDLPAARDEHARALAMIDRKQFTEAEAALKRALAADVTYGPAHNTLGSLYYRSANYYLAAWEFQYAAKLMPSQAEPQNNLGLVFEVTGKYANAIDAYERAMSVDPENIQYVGNAARARIRRGDAVPDVRPLLETIIALDTRPDWLAWARQTLQKGPPQSTSRPSG